MDQGEWEATPENEKFFSSNNVIDAYLKGKRDGMQDEKGLIIEKIKANIATSSLVTHAAFDEMKKINFSPGAAYLKIIDWAAYGILITIPEEEFLHDSVLDVYTVLSGIEDSFKNDYFTVSISLCDTSQEFSERSVAFDGYALKLKHAQEK